MQKMSTHFMCKFSNLPLIIQPLTRELSPSNFRFNHAFPLALQGHNLVAQRWQVDVTKDEQAVGLTLNMGHVRLGGLGFPVDKIILFPPAPLL
jgi:hypothetical protein